MTRPAALRAISTALRSGSAADACDALRRSLDAVQIRVGITGTLGWEVWQVSDTEIELSSWTIDDALRIHRGDEPIGEPVDEFRISALDANRVTAMLLEQQECWALEVGDQIRDLLARKVAA